MEGNVQKMRKALEFADKELRRATEDSIYGDDMVYLVGCMRSVASVCRSALAAPPRNCERFNSGDATKDAADAYDEWQRHCDCSLMPPSCKVESAFRQWLFAKAKSETKGGAK